MPDDWSGSNMSRDVESEVDESLRHKLRRDRVDAHPRQTSPALPEQQRERAVEIDATMRDILRATVQPRPEFARELVRDKTREQQHVACTVQLLGEVGGLLDQIVRTDENLIRHRQVRGNLQQTRRRVRRPHYTDHQTSPLGLYYVRNYAWSGPAMERDARSFGQTRLGDC